jgi:hypothetical protein
MGVINVLTLPEYYYLYALFFDYPLNNAFHLEREERARIRDMLSTVQRWLSLRQPYRKSFALRLFTERDALVRWSPELAVETLRQLKQAVDEIGGVVSRRYPRVHRRLEAQAARRGEEQAAAGAPPSWWPLPDWPHADGPPPPVRYRLTA